MSAFNKAGSEKFAAAGVRFEQITTIGQNILLTGLIIGLLLLFFTDRYLVTCLVRPLNDLRDHFGVIASGQLGKPIKDFGRNCVGRLFPLLREMQTSLANTVSTIRNSTDSIYQGRRKSPRETTICRHVPNSRLRRWKRRPPAWNN